MPVQGAAKDIGGKTIWRKRKKYLYLCQIPTDFFYGFDRISLTLPQNRALALTRYEDMLQRRCAVKAVCHTHGAAGAD